MRRLILTLCMVALAVPGWANPAATEALNDLRASKGRKPVVYSQKLEKIAQKHLNDMTRNNFVGHKGSNGSTLSNRLRQGGYRFCFGAENIAWGQRDLAAAMAEWKGSSGHYKNMMNRKAREFALVRNKKNVWVMVLAAKRC